MNDIADLYQELIIDHSSRPRNFRPIGDAASSAEGYNPLCGDKVKVYVQMDGDVVADASFQGDGCAISKASASLMTESVTGKTVADAEVLCARVYRLLTAPPGAAVEDLGALSALAGVRQFPVRVRCAALPWQALRAAAAASDEVVSTE